MIYIDNIFVIIDPTTDKQYALHRAAKIAKITGAKIHAYLCISSRLETHDQEALRQTERSRYELWLNNILEPIRAEGLEVITQLDWKSDWRSAIGNAAYQAYSDLIVKPSRRRTAKERLMMTSSQKGGEVPMENGGSAVGILSSFGRQGLPAGSAPGQGQKIESRFAALCNRGVFGLLHDLGSQEDRVASHSC